MSIAKDRTEKALVRRYFDDLAAEVGEKNLQQFLSGSVTYADDAPFLSVIMRTQGHRPEALSEVLLCLCGQSDTDFEVIIMGHNLDDVGRESVNSAIAGLPDYMDGKVKLHEVSGGNRTTPLSRGFEAAKGRYISILDDDDIVFDNWVEAFHALEDGYAGMILHSYCASQDWRVTQNESGETVLTSVSGFKTVYCSPFEMLEQLSVNHCPTFSLAFPSYIYNCLGVRFDETLTTTEDWDFLMRCAVICGVADTPQVTGIYRMWVNAESSATLHSEKEWKKNHAYIQNKLKARSLLIPAEEIGALMRSAGSAEHDTAKIREVMVLVDDGSGFGTYKPLKLEFSCENGRWTAKCVNIADIKGIKSLRMDPVASGTVTLIDFSAHLVDTQGQTVAYKVNKRRTNGVFTKNHVVFMGDDPQIRLDLEKPTDLLVAELSFEIIYDVPKGFFRLPILKYLCKHWCAGFYRKIRTAVWKITHIGK